MDIAQQIMMQLKHGGPVMWSWGAHAFKGVKHGQLTDDFGEHLGALVFKVQGALYRGHVAVVLMPDDTYTVRFGSLRTGRFSTKADVNDVYCDDLVSIIDNRVERAA